MVWSALFIPPGDRPAKARHHTDRRGNGATLTVAGGPNGAARLSPVYPGPGGNPYRRRNGGGAHRRTAEGAAAARPPHAGRKGEDPAPGRLAALAQMAEHRDAGRGARAQARARRPAGARAGHGGGARQHERGRLRGERRRHAPQRLSRRRDRPCGPRPRCSVSMESAPAPIYCAGTFVCGVVPERQRRGLFRTYCEGATLRGTLGLPRPETGSFPTAHRPSRHPPERLRIRGPFSTHRYQERQDRR